MTVGSSDLGELAMALLPLPIALVSHRREVLFASPAFHALFPEGGDASDEVLQSLLASDVTREAFLFERDGRSWRADPKVVVEIGEAMTLWVFEDITREVIADANRQEVLSMIVHDLRGPLTGLQGTLDFLLTDPNFDLPDPHLSLAKEAKSEADRMMRLIGGVLEIHRSRSGGRERISEPVAAEILIRRSVLGLRGLADREGIVLLYQLEEGLPAISGEMDPLLQALNNLLVNAVKFTPRGGVVVVDARSAGGDSGPGIVLSVSDTGPGIPLSKQDELFARFAEVGSTSDTAIEGTGLGLFIAKTLIDNLGGKLRFASIPDVGTCFLMELASWEG